MATSTRRFQVQFEVDGDGRVRAAFNDAAAGAGKAGDAIERAGRQADTSADRHERLIKVAKDAGTILGTALAGALVIGTTAVVQWSREMASASRELSTLAALSNTSVENFQRQAVAASSVGIEQQKLADIYKDTQEKLGEFLQTGSGELTDFFKEVAPLVGVTADAFRDLSGPQALQLYYTTLERAGLSHAETITYMEALADEASLLAPLLRDGGAAAQELGDQAQALGAIMGGDALAAAAELQEKLFELDLITLGLKRSVAEEAIPVLSDFVDELARVATEGGGVAEAMDMVSAGFDLIVGTVRVVTSTVRGVTLDLIALANAGQAAYDALTGDWEGAARNAREAATAREMAAAESADIADVFAGRSPRDDAAGPVDIIDVMTRPLDAPPAARPRAANRDRTSSTRARTAATKELTEAEKAYQEVMEVNALIDQQAAQYQTDLVIAEGERMLAERDAADQRREAFEQMRADMEFEIELLGMSAQQREAAIAQRYANVDAMSAEGQELAALTEQLQAAREQAELVEDIKSGLADVFVGFAQGAEEGQKAWDRFMDNLFQRALEFVADQAVNAMFEAISGGSSGGAGGGGGWGDVFASILGAFGGNRATGGSVSPGMFYRVNEGYKSGPELLTVGNDQWLMMGRQGGQVTPNGPRGGDTININIPVQGNVDRRTRQQIAVETRLQLETASRRNR